MPVQCVGVTPHALSRPSLAQATATAEDRRLEQRRHRPLRLSVECRDRSKPGQFPTAEETAYADASLCLPVKPYLWYQGSAQRPERLTILRATVISSLARRSYRRAAGGSLRNKGLLGRGGKTKGPRGWFSRQAMDDSCNGRIRLGDEVVRL